ncbi:MAG: XdhC family protein [Tepidisphaeraceae bacterium]
MRELIDIVAAYQVLAADAKPAALATVIRVEGSAYRRPGARMLIAEDGQTWGGVSGGCLERDVAQRGRGVIASGQAFVARYDTSDDESIGGVGTGCGGTIDVLIQPLTDPNSGPMPVLQRVLQDRRPSVLATITQARGRWKSLAGSSLDLSLAACDWPNALLAAARQAADASRASLLVAEDDDASAQVFVETIEPPQELIIFGAGPDVVPLVRVTKLLGWHVTVVAANGSHAIADRFSQADVVTMTTADHPLAGITISTAAAVVVMTHNVVRDGAILSSLPLRPRYLGVLGPKHRTQRLLDALPASRAAGVFSPVGLDLGAETPEEIAIAICAEIQAFLRQATGQSLRDLDRPIHPPFESPAPLAAEPKLSPERRGVACPL